MTLSCLLLEDQAPARRLLEEYTTRHPDLELMGSTALASLANEMLLAERIDLLFLDLSLPQADGFSFLNSLTSPPVTIITTAFPNRALEGFEAGVADYLVKPISFERFSSSIKRAKTLIDASKGSQSIKIQKSKTEYQTVKVDDISLLSADGDYVLIYTDIGNFHVSGPLSDWQEKLPANRFLRIHRSHIVNKKRIQQRAGSQLTVSNIVVPVGPKYIRQLKQ